MKSFSVLASALLISSGFAGAQCCPVSPSTSALSGIGSLRQEFQQGTEMSNSLSRMHELDRQVDRVRQETQSPSVVDAQDWYREHAEDARAESQWHYNQVPQKALVADEGSADDVEREFYEARQGGKRAEYYSEQGRGHETYIRSDDDEETPSNPSYEVSNSDDTPRGEAKPHESGTRVKDLKLRNLDTKQPDFDNSRKSSDSILNSILGLFVGAGLIKGLAGLLS